MWVGGWVSTMMDRQVCVCVCVCVFVCLCVFVCARASVRARVRACARVGTGWTQCRLLATSPGAPADADEPVEWASPPPPGRLNVLTTIVSSGSGLEASG
jgi:hypothetical protein